MKLTFFVMNYSCVVSPWVRLLHTAYWKLRLRHSPSFHLMNFLKCQLVLCRCLQIPQSQFCCCAHVRSKTLLPWFFPNFRPLLYPKLNACNLKYCPVYLSILVVWKRSRAVLEYQYIMRQAARFPLNLSLQVNHGQHFRQDDPASWSFGPWFSSSLEMRSKCDAGCWVLYIYVFYWNEPTK